MNYIPLVKQAHFKQLFASLISSNPVATISPISQTRDGTPADFGNSALGVSIVCFDSAILTFAASPCCDVGTITAEA
jgi:hypothetical protein